MMGIIKGRNFARGPIAVRAGDTLDGCNLAQTVPGTPIFAGIKGLTFRHCNLARAVVPADAIVEACNTSQAPLPPEPQDVEMVEIEAAELAALRADRAKLKAIEKGVAR